MTQNYYSKRTVEKLRTQLHCAEQNFSSTLADNEKLGKELTDLRASRDEYRKLYQNGIEKINSLQVQLEVLEGKRMAKDACAADVRRGAMQRAHEELHKVKATEDRTSILQRALGNAQGILAAALDANNIQASSVSLYPDEDKKLSGVEGFRNGRF